MPPKKPTLNFVNRRRMRPSAFRLDEKTHRRIKRWDWGLASLHRETGKCNWRILTSLECGRPGRRNVRTHERWRSFPTLAPSTLLRPRTGALRGVRPSRPQKCSNTRTLEKFSDACTFDVAAPEDGRTPGSVAVPAAEMFEHTNAGEVFRRLHLGRCCARGRAHSGECGRPGRRNVRTHERWRSFPTLAPWTLL